jgi:hypothetical protein
MASFLKIIEDIGKDIVKGVEVVAPVLGVVDPPLSPILQEVALVIAALEGSGATVSQSQLSSIVQAVATVSAAKTATASPK